MSIGGALEKASFVRRIAAPTVAGRETLVTMVLLFGLTHGVDVLAGDSLGHLTDIEPMAGGKPLAHAFRLAAPLTTEPFSATEFRPRTFDAIAGETEHAPRSPALLPAQPQPLHSTSAWQRLAEYRTQGRLQLLTLWQSPHNMVSLQAGKHGGPSLQWTGHLDRGTVTRGLLDHFVASSIGAAGAKFSLRATPPISNKTNVPLPPVKPP